MKSAAVWKILASAGALGAILGGAAGGLLNGLSDIQTGVASRAGNEGIVEIFGEGQNPADVITPGIDEAGEVGRPEIAEPASGGDVLTGSGIDYNCNRPGQGFPWLKHQPDEPLPELIGENPGETTPQTFRSTVGDYRVVLPVQVGPTGDMNPAGVYEMLCEVHPNLGGTRLTPLDHMTGSECGACECPYKPVELLDGMWFEPFECWDWSPPACCYCSYEDDPSPELCPREYFFVYTDGKESYWLPPIPEELADALSQPADEPSSADVTEVTGEARFRVELIGVELLEFGEPGSSGHVQVGFSYNMEFELAVEWDNDQIVGALAVPTRGTSRVEARGGRDLETLIATGLNCKDLDRPKLNAILKPDAESSVWLDWGDLEPTATVPRPEDAEGSFEVSYVITSYQFFRQAEMVAVTLKAGQGGTVGWGPEDDGKGYSTTGSVRYDVCDVTASS